MNITKYILKNKTLQIIADDNTVVNNQTLKSLVNKTLKEKIAFEAQSLNMLKEKTAKLPI